MRQGRTRSTSSLRVVPQRKGSPRLYNHQSTNLLCESKRIRPWLCFSMNVNTNWLPGALRLFNVLISEETRSSVRYMKRPSAIQTARSVESKLFLISASLSKAVFFFQAEDGIRDLTVTGVQTCALPI